MAIDKLPTYILDSWSWTVSRNRVIYNTCVSFNIILSATINLKISLPLKSLKDTLHNLRSFRFLDK
jgi:hypothetical protein